MDSLLRDLKFSVRSLLKRPALTIIAVVTLAVGIGANSAIFSTINSLLLKPLPFPDPDLIVALWDKVPSRGVERNEVTVANYLDWRAQNKTFEQLGIYRWWSTNLTGSDSPERVQGFQVTPNFLDIVGQLPGVTAVGGINVLPLQGSGSAGTFLINDDPSQRGSAVYRVASAGYFSAMSIPLLRGRLFDGSDKVNTQHVAVISQSLAQRYWPAEDPIGKRIQFGNMDTDKRLMQIVGIVGDVRDASLEREPQPAVYASSLQRPQWWQVARLALVVRSQSNPQTLIPSLRQTVQDLRSDVPTSFATLQQVFSDSFDGRRFSLTLFGVFGGVALFIAVIGLYGMLTYSVTERTREMGIRMALGAQRGNVLRLVIRQGLRLVAAGIGIGLIGAWGLTRLMTTLLFGVTPTDSITLVAVVMTLAIVALAACYIPARRATKVDPLVALKCE